MRADVQANRKMELEDLCKVEEKKRKIIVSVIKTLPEQK